MQKKSPNVQSGDNYQVHLPLPYSTAQETIPANLTKLCKMNFILGPINPGYKMVNWSGLKGDKDCWGATSCYQWLSTIKCFGQLRKHNLHYNDREQWDNSRV